ncbi:hypothetical protein [Micromonospora globbae]|uniref:hypothetical protein n=1 Tax=Micromonospora globbae TaxID=1894969 RepID=UPI00344185B3
MATRTRRELLTTAEVAALAGITRNYVPRWCARHGIQRDHRASNHPYLYPADAVRAAVGAAGKPLPAELRLRRWVAKALIA